MLLDPRCKPFALSDSQIQLLAAKLEFGPEDDCPSCGGHSFDRIADRDRYGLPLSYVVCVHCGLLFANPYYTEQAIDRFYREIYAVVYGRARPPVVMFAGERERGRKIERAIRMVSRSIALDAKSILDIGCSHGGILAAFASSCIRVGYDYDDSLFGPGRAAGLELTPISQLHLEKRKFDIVMLNQVVEHCLSPVEILRKAAEFATPSGIIYVSVPGLFSTAADQRGDIRHIFKNAHRFHFCADTLARCARHARLRAIAANEDVCAHFVHERAAHTRLTRQPEARLPGEVTAYIQRRLREPGWQRSIHRLHARMQRMTAGSLIRAARRQLGASE